MRLLPTKPWWGSWPYPFSRCLPEIPFIPQHLLKKGRVENTQILLMAEIPFPTTWDGAKTLYFSWDIYHIKWWVYRISAINSMAILAILQPRDLTTWPLDHRSSEENCTQASPEGRPVAPRFRSFGFASSQRTSGRWWVGRCLLRNLRNLYYPVVRRW